MGRIEQALKTIRKAERFNKVKQWQLLIFGRKYRWLIRRLMQVNIPGELLSSKSGEKAAVEEPKQLGIGALFQKANVRRNSLVLFTNWALVSLGYYGISMSSGSLNDNIFISYFLLSLIGGSESGARYVDLCNIQLILHHVSCLSEIPSYLFCMFTLDHLGRKPLFASSMFVTGIFTLICAGVEEGVLKTLLALIGKRWRFSLGRVPLQKF